MKNFPSALIKQKNTKQGLGNNLGTTLKNMGTKVLKNLLTKFNNFLILLFIVINKSDLLLLK